MANEDIISARVVPRPYISLLHSVIPSSLASRGGPRTETRWLGGGRGKGRGGGWGRGEGRGALPRVGNSGGGLGPVRRLGGGGGNLFPPPREGEGRPRGGPPRRWPRAGC